MARYICELCEGELDPKSASVLHLITGWAKGATNNIKKVDTQHYRFVHEFCQPRADDNQLSLFPE